MSQDIYLPTNDEAQRFSDEFDNIVETTLIELNESGEKVRADVIMRDRNEGESSPVRLGATLFASRQVDSDPEIQHYDNPTDDDLREILAKAADYEGNWYHSRVTLRWTGEWTPLQAQVAELDEESGVFVLFHYPSGSALYKHLDFGIAEPVPDEDGPDSPEVRDM